MEEIRRGLYRLQDVNNAAFQAKLTPGVLPGAFLGVRMPELRYYAKQLTVEEKQLFLKELPHIYYDENMLHSVILSGEKDYERCLREVDAFLPYVDNWAVCDTLTPKVFGKHRDELLPEIRRWTTANEVYTIRFGVDMLMTFYLDGEFLPEYHEIPGRIKSDEYYVNMVLAWYFATALAKQWDATIPWLEEKRLSPWVHNKTVQKAIESFRVSEEHKNYLRTLRLK